MAEEPVFGVGAGRAGDRVVPRVPSRAYRDAMSSTWPMTVAATIGPTPSSSVSVVFEAATAAGLGGVLLDRHGREAIPPEVVAIKSLSDVLTLVGQRPAG